MLFILKTLFEKFSTSNKVYDSSPITLISNVIFRDCTNNNYAPKFLTFEGYSCFPHLKRSITVFMYCYNDLFQFTVPFFTSPAYVIIKRMKVHDSI